MNSQPILVTGATGKTGSRIAARLRALGHSVREGTRSSEPFFDWNAPESWADALAGAKAVYVCFQPDFAFPGALDTLAQFADAIHTAEITRTVMITGRGEPYALRGEAVLKEAGLAATILRSAWFAQNFSEGSLRDAVLEGVLPIPGGDIKEPIIDLEDVADIAVAALTEPGHEGQTYELTGPRLLSFAEAAEALSRATGRSIRHLPVSYADFHTHLAASAGVQFADIVTEIARETFDGRNAHITGGVERALGRPPRDFVDFAERAARAGAWRTAA